MTTLPSRCVVCGKGITWQFSLCAGCEKDWGKRARDWPEWLRYLVNQSRRERTSERNYNSTVEAFDSTVEGGLLDEIQFKRWQSVYSAGERMVDTDA